MDERFDASGKDAEKAKQRRENIRNVIIGIFAHEKCTVRESKRILDEARCLVENSTVQTRMTFSELEHLSALMRK